MVPFPPIEGTNASRAIFRANFTIPSDAAGGDHSLRVNATVGSSAGNETREATHTVHVAESPPNYLLLAGLAVLLAAGAVGGFLVFRKRQVKAAPRSSVLQQAEMERKLEKAKAPEEKAAIQAEMRQVEAERSLTREAQIVEAKMADVRKGLDRLKERHDAGQLTQHQYDQMRSKRESQLEDLEREMERLRGPPG